jgi:stearoyl-CoA desaturase (delta-9 desaturase)
MHLIGQASHLKTFPANEIKKGQYTMQLKKLQAQTAELKWPETKLPIVSWEEFVEESKSRPLIAIHGYIIDCESFEADHPGGAHLIKRAIGTDATTAFFGGVYDHSNAAHNLLAMMRVGILEAGMEVEHLKSDFENSPINPDRPSSTLPSPPPGQPMAQMADKSTLNVPPSEHFRIVETVPPPRPSGRKGGLGDVTRTLAQAEGENKEYSGEKLE